MKANTTMDSIFLTKYGLHHFVRSRKSASLTTFLIDGSESAAMIAHARHIITEMYEGASTVMVR